MANNNRDSKWLWSPMDLDPIGPAEPVPVPVQRKPEPVPEPAPRPEPYIPSEDDEEELFGQELDHGWVDGPDPVYRWQAGGRYRDSTGRVRP